MRTHYYLDDNSNLKGSATVYLKKADRVTSDDTIFNTFTFDWDTLPNWYPCSISYDLYIGKNKNSIHFMKCNHQADEIPDYPNYHFADNATKEDTFCMLHDNMIVPVMEANKSIGEYAKMQHLISWEDPLDSYSLADVKDNIQQVTSRMDGIISKLYIQSGNLDNLPAYTNGEGVMLLYRLILDKNLKVANMGIDSRSLNNDKISPLMVLKDKQELERLQAVYLMLQECRKVQMVLL